jgi:hypothetical protein
MIPIPNNIIGNDIMLKGVKNLPFGFNSEARNLNVEILPVSPDRV